MSKKGSGSAVNASRRSVLISSAALMGAGAVGIDTAVEAERATNARATKDVNGVQPAMTAETWRRDVPQWHNVQDSAWASLPDLRVARGVEGKVLSRAKRIEESASVMLRL